MTEAGQSSKIGVILVTYQSAEDLPHFFASLPAAIGVHSAEVVVVDNASTDDSTRIAEAFGVTLVRNATNAGLSRAINQAAAETQADWLLVANPDTRPAPGSVAALLRTAQSDDRIGCVGPRLEDLAGDDYPTGRRFPSPAVGALHAALGPVWPGNPATRAYYGAARGGPRAGSTAVDWVSGSCMLFRRQAFDAVGGFDAGYFMYFEEVDICLRLRRAGWRVVLDRDALVVHREGGSTRFAPFRKVVNHHRSAYRFYCRYHAGDPWLLLAPVVAAGLAVRGGASLARTAVARRRAVG